MARRKKKQGANFGARSGARSAETYKQRERGRVQTYFMVGAAIVILLCLVVWLVSRPAPVTDTSTDDSAETAEVDNTVEEPIVEDDVAADDAAADETTGDGFTSEDVVVEEDVEEEAPVAAAVSTPIEAIDPDSFTLLPSNFELSDLDPEDRIDYYTEMPAMIIDPANTYEAIIVTEHGEMRLRLYADLAPVTVNNFVSLALDGFYDNTTFHRVMSDFMAQGGDPSGTGSGGPGYTFQDEVANDLSFDRRGLLAMANAGPSTNGSQFFITHTGTPWLTGMHTIFGELIEGDGVLADIRIRDPQSDPNLGDLIETIEIYVVE